jgi:hypothetical protein
MKRSAKVTLGLTVVVLYVLFSPWPPWPWSPWPWRPSPELGLLIMVALTGYLVTRTTGEMLTELSEQTLRLHERISGIERQLESIEAMLHNVQRPLRPFEDEDLEDEFVEDDDLKAED